jgi:phenylalanyl-tRNA synthetase alpha chain
MDSIEQQWAPYLEKVSALQSAADIDAFELSLFGRKQGLLNDALKKLGALPDAERRAQGAVLNEWKLKLMQAIMDRKNALRSSQLGSIGESDKLDVTIDLPAQPEGHLHLIPEFIRQVEDVFGRMGFETAEGDEIEHEDLNFTLLNVPHDHPARDAQDTFWVKDVPNTVLRTQTSPVQIHYMRSHKPPMRMICPGRVYRKDADATHSPMFHQCEGLMIDRDVSLAHMKAVMTAAIKALIGDDIEFRFRTGFFPFVEPGLEVDMRLKNADGTPGRWLEVAGCGMVHPTVLKNGKIDPDEFQGFAFGFGIERLLMIKHRIPDLRLFYEGDPRFLRQF